VSQKRQREIRENMMRLVQPQTLGFDALLGDGVGNVEVSGQPDNWYVRPLDSDLPVIVKRGASPKIEGIKVRIEPEFGSDKRRKKRGKMKVMGVVATSDSSLAELTPHGDSHMAGSSDPVYIDTVQIINGLVYATTGLSVTVNPGWIVVDNQPVHMSKSTLSLSSSVPSSGARYSLVRVDADGTVDVQDGAAVANYADLGFDDVPRVADGYVALAAVRLYASQTELSRLYSSPDVFDLRFAPKMEAKRLWDELARLENEIDIEVSRHILGW